MVRFQSHPPAITINMTKKKTLTKEVLIIKALRELPVPLKDNKHRIVIFFNDDRARSNETRFEHISALRHDLQPSDIRRIGQKINDSIMKRDSERNDTFNLYIKRNNYSNEFIKISLELDFKESNNATVKTVFITKNLK